MFKRIAATLSIFAGKLFMLFFALARGLWRLLGWLLHLLLGSFSWQAPGWGLWLVKQLRRLAGWLVRNPRRAAAIVAGIVVLGGSGWYGYRWYQHQPKPILTKISVTAPPLTDYDDHGRPQPKPLVLVFNESAAQVSQIGKAVTRGIGMTPLLAGDWTWTDEKTLNFQPRGDWPVDGDFEVTLAKKNLFAPGVLLEDYSFKFRSAPFTATIQQADFYQDPVDPNLKKLVTTVQFSHPVDADDFKQRVSLKLGDGLKFLDESIQAKAAQTSISFDKYRLQAYIHSAPLAIPREDTALALTLEKGIRAGRGGNKTGENSTRAIVVPGLYSLSLNDISMILVDNERFEPEQVLLVGSSRPVSEKALAGHVHAWLLPEFNPATPLKDRTEPFNWESYGVTLDILKQSQVMPLSAVAAAEEQEAIHSFKFRAPVGRSLYVKVDAGVQAFGGYVSQRPALATVPVQPYPQAIKLLSQGALLSLSGDRKLGYMARGLKGVRVEIGRLLPNQLHHLINHSTGNFATPEVDDTTLDSLVERFDEKRPLPPSEFGKPVYDNIDFGKYLREKGSRNGGVFMVQLQAYDPAAPDNDPGVEPDRRFILVTDIGLIAKKALDGSQDIFAQSIASGLPIAGARIDVIGRNGQAVMTETTDATGLAHFAHMSDFKREKEAIAYVATKDNDLAFLPLNHYDRQLNLSRFDIGGIDNATSPQQLYAYAFTDRGIYRPGETAHIGMITRTANWSNTLEGVPLEAEITDPRGLPVLKQRIKLNASGFDTLDFASRETSATGDYNVGIYLVRNNQRDLQIGSVSFKVRDFEPDRFKVNVTLADKPVEGWIKPEEAVARVTAMQLFGSPANDRRVTAEMTLTPAVPVFARYREYSFQDQFKQAEPFSGELPTVNTDANGQAQLELNLQRFARATYRLYVAAKVFEAAGGRSVSGEAATLVSSAPYLVGVKTDQAISYISRNALITSRWLAIDPALKPTAAAGLTEEWIERKYVSVLVKLDSGVYKYESRKKEIVRESKTFNLPAGGADIALNTSEPGDFALVLKNADGTELNRIQYSVAGVANLSRSLERNAELQLSLNKSDYAPGETIEISVRAPYTGSGLITIERDHVYHHVWFKADTTSSVQKITLPKDFEGNGYVSVQFVRDPGSDEIFMSPLSYGMVPFAVNLDARRQPVKVGLPDIVKPGQVLDMQVSSAQPARVVVFAVDEGILQVARYKTPNPLGYFFQKRALQVSTTQILDMILPDFQRLMNAAAPGGDGDAVLGRHLNPFKKKHQPPVAWWSGMMDIGPQGKTLHYTVPDTFNGKLRVFAVAVTPERIGVFEGGTEVRGDLILSPNLPTTVAPGDEFVVSVSVFNNLHGASGKTPVSLTLKADAALTLLTPAKIELNIAPQQESAVEFRLRANEILGPANLQFVAQSGDRQGHIGDAISIRPATPLTTHIVMGRMDKEKLVQPLTREMYNEHRVVQAGLTLSPLVWAQGLGGFLDSYQYSCTEQLISKGMPALILATGHDLTADQSGFAKVIQVLRERQNEDGSFGLWSANMEVEPYASVYAVHYLVEAKERGLPVPADMLAKANHWMESFATGGSQGLYGVRTRAYAIYLLTRQGSVTSSMIAALQQELDARYAKQWPQDITAAYLAASYKLMQQDATAQKLLKNVPWRSGKPETTSDDEYYVYYGSLSHDAQLLYLISRHFRDHVGDIPADALLQMGLAVSNNYYDTLSAAYLILGFDAYAAAGARDTGNLGIMEIDAHGKMAALALSEGLMKFAKVPQDAARLSFSKDGRAPAFYVLNETGFDRKPQGSVAGGLEISRDILTLQGKPLTQVKIGEEFLVKLSFRSTSKDKVSQVAIVDLLPGGLEPVLNQRAEATPPAPENAQSSASGEGSEGSDTPAPTPAPAAPAAWQVPLGEGNGWRPDYADIRDDRVILYGSLSRAVGTFTYRVRATNSGKFIVPAPFAEGMYNRNLVGRGSVGKLEVVKH